MAEPSPNPAAAVVVGEQVRRRRQQRGWTLDEATARLGVSRRSLAQIEAGQANPSLSSLLAIAAGFEIDLVELLTDADAAVITVQTDNRRAPVLWTGSAGGEGKLLVASGGLELWAWTLPPGESRRSEAHRTGAREALTVTAGAVVIQVVGSDPVTVRRGQSAAFAADADHRYTNESPRAARFLLAVHEPA